MIVEGLVNILLSPLLGLFALLPDISSDFMDEWVYFRDEFMIFLQGVGCLVPITRLMPIAYFEVGLNVFRLGYSVLLRIKSFIPFIGGGS